MDFFKDLLKEALDGPQRARKMALVLILTPMVLMLVELTTGYFTELYYQNRLKTAAALFSEAKGARELSTPSAGRLIVEADELLRDISSQVVAAQKLTAYERAGNLGRPFLGGALLWILIGMVLSGRSLGEKGQPSPAQKQTALGIAQIFAWLGVMSGLIGVAFNSFTGFWGAFLLFPLMGGVGAVIVIVFAGLLLGPKS